MRTQELKEFAEERNLTLRFLKTNYKDIIYREGRKQSIDVEAYEELMPKRSSNSRRKPSFTQKTILKREYDKVDKFDQFILASGQEVEFLAGEKEQESDPRRITLLEFEIEELQEAIAEKERLKRRAEMKIDLIIPPSKKTDSKDSKKS